LVENQDANDQGHRRGDHLIKAGHLIGASGYEV
jgi:hypothetical protein